MNKLFLTISRNHLRLIVALLCGAFGAALAVSAVIAGAMDKQDTRRGNCKDWVKDADKPAVAAAFDEVLKEASMDTEEGRALRKRLLNKANCYKEPKAAVQERLDKKPGKITFPPDAVIMFYENDSEGRVLSQRPFSGPPTEQCLHILALGEVGQTGLAAATFRENLMCCYKPWPDTLTSPAAKTPTDR